MSADVALSRMHRRIRLPAASMVGEVEPFLWLAVTVGSYAAPWYLSPYLNILIAACAFGLLSILAIRRPQGTSGRQGPALIGIAAFAYLIPRSFASALPERSEVLLQTMMIAVATACLLLLLLVPSRRAGHFAAALAISTMFAACALTILSVDQPETDVWLMLQQGSSAVWRQNIYQMSWSGGALWASVDSFAYLPMSAILLSPAALLGDVRWGLLACSTCLSLLLVRFSSPSGQAWAVLLCFSPNIIMLIEWSWNEPLLGVLLVGSMLAFFRGKRGLGVVLLALALATKQHVWLLLPVLAAWHSAGWRRVTTSAVLALCLMAPWIVANPRQFVSDTVLLHLDMPAPKSSISLYAVATHFGWTPAPGLLVLLLAVIVGAVALLNFSRPTDLSAAFRSCAAVLLTANLLNKQTFYNQMWLVGVIWLFALAARDAEPNALRPQPEPPSAANPLRRQ